MDSMSQEERRRMIAASSLIRAQIAHGRAVTDAETGRMITMEDVGGVHQDDSSCPSLTRIPYQYADPIGLDSSLWYPRYGISLSKGTFAHVIWEKRTGPGGERTTPTC